VNRRRSFNCRRGKNYKFIDAQTPQGAAAQFAQEVWTDNRMLREVRVRVDGVLYRVRVEVCTEAWFFAAANGAERPTSEGTDFMVRMTTKGWAGRRRKRSAK